MENLLKMNGEHGVKMENGIFVYSEYNNIYNSYFSNNYALYLDIIRFIP